jgi:hypothetical protein
MPLSFFEGNTSWPSLDDDAHVLVASGVTNAVEVERVFGRPIN